MGGGSDNRKCAVSVHGRTSCTEASEGQSPQESDSRATAPAPTCPDGKPQETYGNMKRDKVNKEGEQIFKQHCAPKRDLSEATQNSQKEKQST